MPMDVSSKSWMSTAHATHNVWGGAKNDGDTAASFGASATGGSFPRKTHADDSGEYAKRTATSSLEYGSFTAGATQQRGKVVPVYGKQAPGTKAGMASANLGRARPRGESRRVTMTESDMFSARTDSGGFRTDRTDGNCTKRGNPQKRSVQQVKISGQPSGARPLNALRKHHAGMHC